MKWHLHWKCRGCSLLIGPGSDVYSNRPLQMLCLHPHGAPLLTHSFSLFLLSLFFFILSISFFHWKGWLVLGLKHCVASPTSPVPHRHDFSDNRASFPSHTPHTHTHTHTHTTQTTHTDTHTRAASYRVHGDALHHAHRLPHTHIWTHTHTHTHTHTYAHAHSPKCLKCDEQQ